MLRKAISLFLSFSFLFTQPVFSQGAAQLNIGSYLSQAGSVLVADKFRPLHMRYFSYDIEKDNFQLLLDKGDNKDIKEDELQEKTQILMDYFKIGLSLPNEKFWVNLRPDAQDRIIDPELEKTDMGRIMLAADLQLKKDTSGMTSPQTPEGKAYWDKLYKKAGELFGSENITIPTITRPWIVPGEIILREGEGSAYIFKANMKVMLEHDYLNSQVSTPNNKPLSSNYNFSDPRMKELNEYSTQLIRELIIPKLTKEVNTSKRYAALRQVFFSLVMARWFKDTFTGKPGTYARLIDSHNLNNLTSKEDWSKTYYFNEYKKSFEKGEYNLKEQAATPTGQVIRSYVSGGADMMGTSHASTPMVISYFKNMIKNRILLPVALVSGLGLVAPDLNSPDGEAADYFLNNHMQISPEEVEELNQTKIEEGIIRQGWTRDFIEAFVAIVGPSLKFDKVGIGIYSIPIDGGIIRIGVENDRCVVTIELRNGNAYSLEYGRIKGKKEALSLNGSPSGVDPETKIREIGMALNSLQEWPDFTIKWVSSLLVKRGIDHDLIDKFLNRTGDRYREPSVPGQDPNTISYKIPVYNQSLPGISYMEIDASGEEYVITIYLGDKNHFEATISLDGNVRVDTANVDFRRRGPGFTGNLVETIYQSLSGGGKSSAPITSEEEGGVLDYRALPNEIKKGIYSGVLKPDYVGNTRYLPGGFLFKEEKISDFLYKQKNRFALLGRFLAVIAELIPEIRGTYKSSDKAWLAAAGRIWGRTERQEVPKPREEVLYYINNEGQITGRVAYLSKDKTIELKDIEFSEVKDHNDSNVWLFLLEVLLLEAAAIGKDSSVVINVNPGGFKDRIDITTRIIKLYKKDDDSWKEKGFETKDLPGDEVEWIIPISALDEWRLENPYFSLRNTENHNKGKAPFSISAWDVKEEIARAIEVLSNKRKEISQNNLRSSGSTISLIDGSSFGNGIQSALMAGTNLLITLTEYDPLDVWQDKVKRTIGIVETIVLNYQNLASHRDSSLLNAEHQGYLDNPGNKKRIGEELVVIKDSLDAVNIFADRLRHLDYKISSALNDDEKKTPSSAPSSRDVFEEFGKINKAFSGKMEEMQKKYKRPSNSISKLISGTDVGNGMDALLGTGMYLSSVLAGNDPLDVWQEKIRRYIEMVEKTVSHYNILRLNKDPRVLKVSKPGYLNNPRNKKINDKELGTIQDCLDASNLLYSRLKYLEGRIQEAIDNDKEKASSGMGKVVGAPEDAGGIDFRAMNYLVQPMGSFKDLQFGLPTLNSSALERIDLDEELKKLRDMVKNGIVPSGMRVKEYLAACFQKGKIEEKQDDLLVCLAEIYRLAEEENLETSPQLRESLVIVDTGKFVLLPNNQKVGLN